MTGYTLEIGYLSAADRDAAWAQMKTVAGALRRDAARLIGEVRRLEPNWTESELRPFAALYATDEDLTLRIIEGHEQTADGRAQVRQLASGGGVTRDIKEAMRRAFCRLVIEEMHRRCLEVNLIVS